MNHKNLRCLSFGFVLFLAAVLLCTTPTHLSAQTVSGTILGVVTDQQTAVIAEMQFRAEMFNILNNTNLAARTFKNTFDKNGVLIPSFGTPTAPTYNQSRQIQFGLRLLF